MGSNAVGAVALAFFSLLSWGIYGLHWRVRRKLGYALGALLARVGHRSAIIDQNLQLAYPGAEASAELKRLQLKIEAYRHLGQLVIEILLLLGPMKRYCRKYCDLKGIENWRSAQAQGKGALFISSHVGNWELMAATGAREGIELLIVTKHLKPEWFHRAIERGRAACRVLGTYEPKTLRDVLAHLKLGRTVGFVLDQYAGPPVGVRVPFFGVPVGTAAIVATLGRRTQAPVLPVVSYRTPEGRLVVEIQPAIEWIVVSGQPAREIATNTARYAAALEVHVRQHPEQWLWTHRRFKGNLAPLAKNEWDLGRVRS